MSTIKFNLDNLTNCAAPLHSRYAGQSSPQPAYVEMTAAGEVSADFSGEIGNAVPADVWHGVRLHWPVLSSVRGDSLADLLRGDALHLLERVHAGHSVEWDGSNHVGRLDADAVEASDDLRELLNGMQDDESAMVPVWDVRDWLFESGAFADAWPAELTLAAAVQAVRGSARGEAVQLDGNIEQCLLREARRVYDEDNGKLGAQHLTALVAEREITQEQADEYRADHDIKDAPAA